MSNKCILKQFLFQELLNLLLLLIEHVLLDEFHIGNCLCDLLNFIGLNENVIFLYFVVIFVRVVVIVNIEQWLVGVTMAEAAGFLYPSGILSLSVSEAV